MMEAPKPNKSPQVKEWGPIAAAAITAAASLLLFVAGQVRHIDERLDKLEQEARVLISGDGGVRASREALEAKYHLEALIDRVRRLEERIKP
jgi:uncharacterized protein (UPF0335 family)